MKQLPISPLALNQLTREYWGQFDPAVMAQLAALANDPCYQFKLYKSPADDQELFAAYGFVTHGLRITPGSLIYGYYLPAIVNLEGSTLSAPGAFTVQITDVSLGHKFFDQAVSSRLVANFKPTYQSNETSASAPAGGLNMGSFPHLIVAPHPVVGSGQFDVEIQETSGAAQRIQFVIGVLEACGVG
jgi:hypothetical protein